MFEGKKILGLITARGGSKGLPRKNILSLNGKPLINWTIKAGLQSKYIDRLVLSSDDNEIISIAKEYGCDVPFIRPTSLSTDKTSSIEVILHAIEEVPGYEYIALLQPTSPLRTCVDIDACITKCIKQNKPACITVTKNDKPPEWMYLLNDDETMRPLINNDNNITRRQDTKEIYVINGAVYVAKIRWLKSRLSFLSDETVAVVMPKFRSIDIDDRLDFIFAEKISEFKDNADYVA